MKTSESNSALSVQNLEIGYQKKPISKPISFHLKKGELTGIVGVNGVGKSTLLRTLCNFQPKVSGAIYYEGINIEEMDAPTLAKKMSVVLTEPIASKNMKVKEVLALGRQPYTNWLGSLSQVDIDIIHNSIALLSLEPLIDKNCSEVSDGQLQRIMIARALVQETDIILLDEPTTHLDLYHKVDILKLLKSIAQKTQKTILFTSHEIELAIQLCDKILLLDRETNAFDTPCNLIANKNFETLFPTDTIRFDEHTGSFKIKK